ncbi:MAG TPA: hypothetical protein VGL47_46245 [Amycolatopsis sp.]|uniref:HNH endonuclease n=1 Tax=Amycolatopsis sp. TaxID=37632 RepID=UPI002F41A683
MRVNETLIASCTGIQDKALKKRLLARESDLSTAEKAYTDAAASDDLYALALKAQATQESSPDPDSSELVKLYKAGLVGRKAGRVKYEALKAGAPFGRCPLCGNGEVHTLDHHLPKESYPLYAITPANLVPACGKCNLAKGDRIGTTADQRTLHPYYDHPGESGRFLIADIDRWPVRFRIQPLPQWSTELTHRVSHHFEIFDLARRFAEFAVSPVVENQWLHRRLLHTSGPVSLGEHLLEDADQHAKTHGLNTWGTALRYGLATSAWYVEHGVHQAP